MKKDIEDFFKEKKPWSEVKDELLACYLEPYFSKIIQTHKPVNYIDCFAGRGKFEDGKNGSPVIALQALEKSLKLSTFKEATTKSYFIEPIYTQELIENLKEFKESANHRLDSHDEQNKAILVLAEQVKNMELIEWNNTKRSI